MLPVEQIEHLINAEQERCGIPGLSLAIVRDCELVYARGFGVTSLESDGVPVTPATLFRIGSVTKPLTATAVLRLCEQQVLDLDCPIVNYLPWLVETGYPQIEQFTLRMLLSHTSGLPQDFFPWGKCDPRDMADAIREALFVYTAVAPPGVVYSYSNPGIDLAGLVAACAVGVSFPTLLEQQVFGPLGMERTTFDPVVALTHPLALGHAQMQDGRLVVERFLGDNVAQHPSTFALSNVLDLARFAALHLGDGRIEGQPLLAPESIAAMCRPHARLYLPDQRHAGLGWQIWRYQGMTIVGHHGDTGVYSAWLTLIHHQRAAVVLLANRLVPVFDGEALIGRMISPAPMSESLVQPVVSRPPPFVGTFVGAAVGLVRIRAQGQATIIEVNGRSCLLYACEDDRYEGCLPDGATLSVGFVVTGAVEHYLIVNGAPCHRFDEAAVCEPNAQDLSDYVGVYARLDRLVFWVKDGQLLMYSEEERAELPCWPITRSLFAFDWGIIEFLRGSDGCVNGFRARAAFIIPRVA